MGAGDGTVTDYPTLRASTLSPRHIPSAVAGPHRPTRCKKASSIRQQPPRGRNCPGQNANDTGTPSRSLCKLPGCMVGTACTLHVVGVYDSWANEGTSHDKQPRVQGERPNRTSRSDPQQRVGIADAVHGTDQSGVLDPAGWGHRADGPTTTNTVNGVGDSLGSVVH